MPARGRDQRFCMKIGTPRAERTEGESVDGVSEARNFAINARARAGEGLLSANPLREPFLETVEFGRRELLDAFRRFLNGSSIVCNCQSA